MNLKVLFCMLCVVIPVHGGKPALLTTKDGRHFMELSAQAVEHSGPALRTLIESDCRAIPIISLDAIATEHAPSAREELTLFVQCLEQVAALQEVFPQRAFDYNELSEQLAHEDELSEHLAQKLQELPLLSFVRLFKHADFYGVPRLLPVLEQQLGAKIDEERTSLTAQLAQGNKLSLLAELPARVRSEVVAQEIMQRHHHRFFTVGKSPQLLTGHSAQTSIAQFSSDGSQMVTASHDNTARVWKKNDSNEWIAVEILSGHTGVLVSAQFSPDGSKIVTASWDDTARVWEKNQDGQWVTVALVGDDGWIDKAQFSPDGSKIITELGDNTVRVWQNTLRNDWVIAALLDGHTQCVNSAQFSPDSTAIVTASKDGTARVWQQDEHRDWVTVALLEDHTEAVVSAQFSPDGTKIITAAQDYTARIWQKNENGEWESVATLEGHAAFLNNAQFSPDGTKVVTAASDSTARVWEQNENGEWVFVATLDGSVGRFLNAQFSPDGTTIVTISNYYYTRVWKCNEQGEWVTVATLKGNSNAPVMAQFSPDGLQIITASESKTPQVWNVLDVVDKNERLGCAATLEDVLLTLDQLENPKQSFVSRLLGCVVREEERILSELIEKFTRN